MAPLVGQNQVITIRATVKTAAGILRVKVSAFQNMLEANPGSDIY